MRRFRRFEMPRYHTVTGPIGNPFDTPPPFNARKLKQDAISALQPLLNGPDKKRVQAAVAEIQASLDPILWVDDSHLTSEGRRVFDAERKAVNDLEKIKAPNTAVAEVVASLVEIDGTRAQIAFDQAVSAGGAENFLSTAQRFLDRAQTFREPIRPSTLSRLIARRGLPLCTL
jgi:hypothetical protein